MTSYQNDRCPELFEVSAYMADMVGHEERERLQRHFLTCEKCRWRIREMARVKTDAEKGWETPVLPRAWDKMESMLSQWDKEQKPTVTQSKSRKSLILKPRVKKYPRPDAHKLAATTKTEETPPIVSYASDDGTVLGKLLSDEETGSPFLYLMSEDMEIVLDAYVRIRGPEMELIFEGLPDDSGAVDLSGLPEFDPGDSHVEIVMPEMTIKLEPRTLHDRLVGKNAFQLEIDNGQSIRIDLIAEETGRQYRLDFSGLKSTHPSCTIRIYATTGTKTSELPLGPEGVAFVRDLQSDPLLIKAYVL